MATLQRPPQLTLGPELAAVAEAEERTLGQVVSNGPAPFATETLSTFLAQLVARLHGVDPTDDDLRLYDHVDPEALDDLFEHAMTHARTSWQLELEIGPETIVIDSNGFVRLAR